MLTATQNHRNDALKCCSLHVILLLRNSGDAAKTTYPLLCCTCACQLRPRKGLKGGNSGFTRPRPVIGYFPLKRSPVQAATRGRRMVGSRACVWSRFWLGRGQALRLWHPPAGWRRQPADLGSWAPWHGSPSAGSSKGLFLEALSLPSHVARISLHPCILCWPFTCEQVSFCPGVRQTPTTGKLEPGAHRPYPSPPAGSGEPREAAVQCASSDPAPRETQWPEQGRA